MQFIKKTFIFVEIIKNKTCKINRTGQKRSYSFCLPGIFAAKRVIILKHIPPNAHFSILQLIRYSKQSTKPGKHEFYPNSGNF